MKPGVQELRDRLESIIAEDLPDEQLKLIFPQVKDEWIRLFPESSHLLVHLENRTATGLPIRQAFAALFEVADRYVTSEGKAAGYRAETEELRQKATELLAGFGAKLRK